MAVGCPGIGHRLRIGGVMGQISKQAPGMAAGEAIARRRGASRIGPLLVLIAGVACAAAQEPAGQWPSYGRDHTEQRFSPLDAVNTRTVGKLGLQWWLDLPRETALVSTPLMIGDTLYFSGKFGVVYAVNARTGTLRWTYDPGSVAVLARSPPRLTINMGMTRGVGWWAGKVFIGTPDGRLVALDASSGKEVWSVQTFDPATPRYITGAPLVFNGKVLIGHGGGDFGAVRGYVTAYDARTGRQLWRFHTVPGNPADGFESPAMAMAAKTWTGEWWKFGGGGTVWNSMTYDPDFNRVYLGTGNGAPWNQAVRSPGGGDNLFLASIVALDADTGEYAWHYQQNPGETWDYNSAMDMVLADLSIEGRPRKVLMHAPKNGFFYVIDRATGRVVSAEPYARTTWATKIDLASGRPVEAPGARAGAGVATIWPGAVGAHSWAPMSFNPATGLVYIPKLELLGHFDARGIDPARWRPTPFQQGWGYTDILGRNLGAAADGDANVWGDDTSGAYLQARDPVRNRTIWEVKQPGIWSGGTLTTAGGLIFIGQQDGHLTGYDARTGAVLWRFDARRPIAAPPISWALDGVQRISVLVGRGGTSGAEGSLGDPAVPMGYRDGGRRLLTFALDARAKLPETPISVIRPIRVQGFVPDAAKARRGEQLFDLTCAICHGTNALSGGGAPDLRASPLAADPAQLQRIVLEGLLSALGMPRYSDFKPADVESIYHYIRLKAAEDSSKP